MALFKALVHIRNCRYTLQFNQQRRLLSFHGNAEMTAEDLRQSFTAPDGLPRIRDRPFLPGSNGKNMPESLQRPSKDFPLIIRASDLKVPLIKSLRQISERARPVLDELLRTNPCVLIRGLPLQTPHDFAEFFNNLGFDSLEYTGGNSTRPSIGKNILPASVDASPFSIEPHSAMSYWPEYPAYIFMYCDVPAEPHCGGENVLLDVRAIKRDLPSAVWNKMKSKRILYNRYCSPIEAVYAANYQQVFGTDDKKRIDEIITERGHQHEWQDDGSLKFWYTLPAMRPHRITGEEVWFNQATCSATYFWAHPLWQDKLDTPVDKLPFHAYYGDGTAIEPEDLQAIRDVSWKNAVGLRMEQGDVVVIDNMFVQHARMGYVGQRKMVIAHTI